jgi:hypothetical protein
MCAVDESMCLIDLAPKLRPMPALKSCTARRGATIALLFNPLQLAGQPDEVSLQRSQHLPRLRC